MTDIVAPLTTASDPLFVKLPLGATLRVWPATSAVMVPWLIRALVPPTSTWLPILPLPPRTVKVGARVSVVVPSMVM